MAVKGATRRAAKSSNVRKALAGATRATPRGKGGLTGEQVARANKSSLTRARKSLSTMTPAEIERRNQQIAKRPKRKVKYSTGPKPREGFKVWPPGTPVT